MMKYDEYDELFLYCCCFFLRKVQNPQATATLWRSWTSCATRCSAGCDRNGCSRRPIWWLGRWTSPFFRETKRRWMSWKPPTGWMMMLFLFGFQQDHVDWGIVWYCFKINDPCETVKTKKTDIIKIGGISKPSPVVRKMIAIASRLLGCLFPMPCDSSWGPSVLGLLPQGDQIAAESQLQSNF